MKEDAASFIHAALSAFEHSVRSHDGALRNVQFATVSSDWRPRIRTVVVRDFARPEAFAARAEIHSDARAEKVKDVAERGDVSLLAWSSADHLHLRFEGTASLHHRDALARERWDALPPGARKAYGLSTRPGAVIDDPGAQTNMPPEAQFEQFVVVVVALSSVDVLCLLPDGRQKRAFATLARVPYAADWIGP